MKQEQQEMNNKQKEKTTTTNNNDKKGTTQTLGIHSEDQHARRNYTHRGATINRQQQNRTKANARNEQQQ